MILSNRNQNCFLFYFDGDAQKNTLINYIIKTLILSMFSRFSGFVFSQFYTFLCHFGTHIHKNLVLGMQAAHFLRQSGFWFDEIMQKAQCDNMPMLPLVCMGYVCHFGKRKNHLLRQHRDVVAGMLQGARDFRMAYRHRRRKRQYVPDSCCDCAMSTQHGLV